MTSIFENCGNVIPYVASQKLPIAVGIPTEVTEYEDYIQPNEVVVSGVFFCDFFSEGHALKYTPEVILVTDLEKAMRLTKKIPPLGETNLNLTYLPKRVMMDARRRQS